MFSVSEKLKHTYIVKSNHEMQRQRIGKRQLGCWVMYAMIYEVPEFEILAETLPAGALKFLTPLIIPIPMGSRKDATTKSSF